MSNDCMLFDLSLVSSFFSLPSPWSFFPFLFTLSLISISDIHLSSANLLWSFFSLIEFEIFFSLFLLPMSFGLTNSFIVSKLLSFFFSSFLNVLFKDFLWKPLTLIKYND